MDHSLIFKRLLLFFVPLILLTSAGVSFVYTIIFAVKMKWGYSIICFIIAAVSILLLINICVKSCANGISIFLTGKPLQERRKKDVKNELTSIEGEPTPSPPGTVLNA